MLKQIGHEQNIDFNIILSDPYHKVNWNDRWDSTDGLWLTMQTISSYKYKQVKEELSTPFGLDRCLDVVMFSKKIGIWKSPFSYRWWCHIMLANCLWYLGEEFGVRISFTRYYLYHYTISYFQTIWITNSVFYYSICQQGHHGRAVSH